MSRWSSMWSKIETEEQALQVVREASKGFLFLAGLMAVLALLVSPLGLIDAAIYAILALWLRHSHSRIAAVLLVLVSLGALGVTVWNRVGGGPGGRNIFLAVIVLWVSVRAVWATFKLGGPPAPTDRSPTSTTPKVKVYG